MKLGDQVRASCSLLLVLTGCNLFVRSKFLKAIRWTLRVWFIVCSLLILNGMSEKYRKTKLSLSSLAYTSYAFGLSVSFGYLLVYRKRYESLLTSLIHTATENDLQRWRKMIGKVNVLLTIFYPIEIVMNQIAGFLSLPSQTLSLDNSQVMWTLVSLFTNWVSSTCGFYVIVKKLLFLCHKELLLDSVNRLSSGRIELPVISRRAKLIRDSSRDFDQLFSIFPFLWFFFGILGAPLNLLSMAKLSGIDQLMGLMFFVRNTVIPVVAAIPISMDQSALFDTVSQAQDLIMMHHTKGACDDGLAIRELESIKSIKFTGMSFFNIDKSFILSYIGTILTLDRKSVV